MALHVAAAIHCGLSHGQVLPVVERAGGAGRGTGRGGTPSARPGEGRNVMPRIEGDPPERGYAEAGFDFPTGPA